MLVDHLHSNCLSELYQRAGALDATRYLYLLIDGAFISGSHKLIHEQEKKIMFETLPSCNDVTRDVSPFLVNFNNHNHSHCLLLEKCSGWPMLSVIETEETLAQLAARLAAWCIVDVDGQSFNFRFADTRRLPMIARVLTPAQTVSFMGPVTRWDYVGRDGNWCGLDVNPQNGSVESNPRFDSSQFASLVQDSQADEILALLAYRGQELSGPPSENFKIVIAAINKVGKIGLNELEVTEEILSMVRAHSDGKENLSEAGPSKSS